MNLTSRVGEVKGLGAYAEYTVADERICYKVPSGITSAAASTVPLAAATAWLAMFSKECLGMDRKGGDTILVWGGSCELSILLSSALAFGFLFIYWLGFIPLIF